MNNKDKQIRINDTLRKYEWQNGMKPVPNKIASSEAEGDEHFLVKCLVCRAIQTGKHLFWGCPDIRKSHHDCNEGCMSDDYFLSSILHKSVKLVWENDHAGEPMSFITEAIRTVPMDAPAFGIRRDKIIRIDIVREDGKEIEIMDKNEKWKTCPNCKGDSADPKQAGEANRILFGCKCKNGKVPDYPADTDVVVI